MPRLAIVCLVVVAFIAVAACGGGGGGGGGDGGSSAARTTFTGNLAAETARGEPSPDPRGVQKLLTAVMWLMATTQARAADVQVCVEGTTFCTFVDDDGVFTLAADVGGDVTLVFTGPDFVARVTLTGIPLGATVRLRNVRCSTITGTCEPEDFEIDGGAETRSAIRCEQGPVRVTHVGELVIEGDGGDCIRTAGQCEVTIEADRIVLQGCDTCVRSAGGSAVTLAAGAGGIECHADGDGIVAAGNSTVHLDAAAGGDVDIHAEGVGCLSEGTALIALAGDQCRIEGEENALRINGNAVIDTDGCALVDLVGGEGDDEGDDHDDDD